MNERTLSLTQCKEYLKNIKDLEISCYQQQKLLQALNEKVHQATISQRKNENADIGEPPTKPGNSHGTNIVASLFIEVIAILIGAVAGLPIGLIRWLCSGDGFFSNFENGIDAPLGTYIKSTALVLGGVMGVIALLYLLWVAFIYDSEKDYNKDLADYEKRKALKEEQITKSVSVANHCLAERDKCERSLTDTRQLLNRYYGMNFIYPKYRGLVPICTLYEYLESGRCFTLVGHEGAYNLYESELRMNMIIEKLDDIIYRLDDISSTQRILAQELKKCNAKIDSLCRSMDRIEQNTELTQYYSQVTALNTSYMAWLTYIDQK